MIIVCIEGRNSLLDTILSEEFQDKLKLIDSEAQSYNLPKELLLEYVEHSPYLYEEPIREAWFVPHTIFKAQLPHNQYSFNRYRNRGKFG